MDKQEQEEWWTVVALASFILVSIAAVYKRHLYENYIRIAGTPSRIPTAGGST